MKTDDLDTVLVGSAPMALVLHSHGVAVGHAFFAPNFVILVNSDATQIIKTTEDHLDAWLDRLSVSMGRPVEIWS
ncbi:hypothetical protein KBX03_22715 [Micromonospora sp. C72]|uniref:hypothetical protein n=1 Tax=Micromonospora sp. C72 TaxID=2824880 RepID=UPI001B394E6E|nr:hypothetical protein [Micromonospora sp. C72]MBQ1045326.1 hypothetical protein [Micromonospora sp. C72]